MDRINNFSNRTNFEIHQNSDYKKLKQAYLVYMQQTNKSDLANSPRRYLVELTFVRNIIGLVPKGTNNEESEKWKKREQEICGKLLEWGIKMD